MAQRFRFRLQTVLRVRGLREREVTRRFGAKQAEIARLDRLNQETATEILSAQAMLLDTQRGDRFDALELARQRAWVGHLRHTVFQRQLARQELVMQLDVLRAEFQQARTARRVIEKLRERRFEEYRREQNLRDQTEADELALRLHGSRQ